MTKEELLKPRYKVIADYPQSGFKVGDIWPNVAPEWTTEEQRDFTLSEMAHYPHLFRKLQWWEERSREDLPDYVKVQLYFDATPSFISMIDDKVEYNFIDDECHGIRWKKGGGTLPDYLQPATLEEYTAYQSSSNQK